MSPKEKEFHCQLDWGILIIQTTHFCIKGSEKSHHKEILFPLFNLPFPQPCIILTMKLFTSQRLHLKELVHIFGYVF